MADDLTTFDDDGGGHKTCIDNLFFIEDEVVADVADAIIKQVNRMKRHCVRSRLLC